MASILDRYGIKEVADVTFYHLSNAGAPEYPVLYLDTLKVSTIETTAEEAYAQGGKGNARLIGWDFNKEITLTLQDALFSAKSLAIMFGAGELKGNIEIPDCEVSAHDGSNSKWVMRTIRYTPKTSGAADENQFVIRGKQYAKHHTRYYKANGESISVSALSANETYLETFDVAAIDSTVIDINADTFSGTYYITGDTYVRNEASGEDSFFQFIVPKAKISSEVTLTLEAEGDPTVFDMSLTVLRPDDGVMMKLVKYDVEASTVEAGATNWYHAEDLNGTNQD